MNQERTAKRADPARAPYGFKWTSSPPVLIRPGRALPTDERKPFPIFQEYADQLRAAGCGEDAIEALARNFTGLLNLYRKSRGSESLDSFVPVIPFANFSFKEQCLALAAPEAQLLIPTFPPTSSARETQPYFAVNIIVHQVKCFTHLDVKMRGIPKSQQPLSVAAVLGFLRARYEYRRRGFYAPDGGYIIYSADNHFQVTPVPDDPSAPHHLLILTAKTRFPEH